MFRKKGVLLFVCLAFILASVFMYADEAELERLRAQGQREGWTFTVGKTSVSDMPLSAITGLKIPKNWQKNAPYDNIGSRESLGLPTSWDWRDYGKVTSVKDQGSCGSCWAFGMLGSYEGILAVNDQGLNNLSEQFLVRCNSYGYGCNGGWWCYDDMYDGIPLESCYPYTATDGSCNHNCSLHFPVDSWYYVGNGSSVPSTSALKQAIYDYGPLSVAVYVNSAFQYYTSGIFNSCSNSSPNHAVVLVGWNDTGGYWILKNSWGTGWGESGYMRITYGCSNIGYAASYAIPKTTTPDIDPPIISNVNAVDITASTARITWTTDEPATSVVYYGTTTSYGQTASTPGYTTSHSVNLTGLTPETLYHFKVESTDSSSNTAQSDDYTFTTLPEGQNPEIYVYDISMEKFQLWFLYRAEATITIKDTNGGFVPNATVYVQWSGHASGTDSGATNSSGQVTFNSGWYFFDGTFTITVTDVDHATMQYNPALNNETSDSI
jgi:hypothetical protein